MSWYYSYSIGYRDKNGILFPIGPFNHKGKLRPILEKSRSFTSHIYERFYPVKPEAISDELMKAWYSDLFEDTVKEELYVSYLPISELSDKPVERRGYFLTEDIESYLKGGDTWEIFYDYLEPEIYAMRVESELKFGPPKPKKDMDGGDITPHSVSEYSYFSFIDYNSEEYDEYRLKLGVEMFEFEKIPEDAEMVIILHQG